MLFGPFGANVLYDGNTDSYQLVSAEGIESMSIPERNVVKLRFQKGVQVKPNLLPIVLPYSIQTDGGPPVAPPSIGPAAVTGAEVGGQVEMEIRFYSTSGFPAVTVPMGFSLTSLRIGEVSSPAFANPPAPPPPPP